MAYLAIVPRFRRNWVTASSSSGGKEEGRGMGFGRRRCSIAASLLRSLSRSCSKAGLKGVGGLGLDG